MNNFNKKNSKKNSKKSNLNKKDKIKKIKNDNTNNSNNINNNDNENNNNNNKINNSIDIKCKYCENKYKIIKKGIKGKYNKQIYYCKNCKKYFSIGKDNRIRRDEKLKELALLLYSHNSSLRSIQSVIEKFYNTKISFCVITNWIKTMTKLLKIDVDSNNKTNNNNSSSSNNKNSNNKNDKNINNNSNQNNKERSKRKNKIDILEMDELWSYYYDLKKKEEKESKYGLLLIGTEIKLLHIK